MGALAAVKQDTGVSAMAFQIQQSAAVWAPLFYLGTVGLIINRKGTENLADIRQIDEWGRRKNTVKTQ